MINIVVDEIIASVLEKHEPREYTVSIGNIVCLGSVLDTGPVSDDDLWHSRMEYFKENELCPDAGALEDHFNQITENYNTMMLCIVLPGCIYLYWRIRFYGILCSAAKDNNYHISANFLEVLLCGRRNIHYI